MGDAASNGSVQKVENNRFARADLERRLLMIDDDMDMNALPKTNYIKTIVTAEAKLDLERKGVQSYQRDIYARFLCFGNGAAVRPFGWLLPPPAHPDHQGQAHRPHG